MACSRNAKKESKYFGPMSSLYRLINNNLLKGTKKRFVLLIKYDVQILISTKFEKILS